MILNGFNDRGALTQLLMRRLNMTGNAPVPVLMPELGANLVLESDRPEWRVLKEEYNFSYGSTQAAVVGESAILWIPPLANGLVAVINSIIVAPSATALFNIIGRAVAPALTGAPGIQNPSNTDDRATDNVPWLWFQGTNPAIPAAARFYARYRTTNSAPFEYRAPLVVTNRMGVCIYTTTQNVAVDFTVSGYYRRAQPGELV